MKYYDLNPHCAMASFTKYPKSSRFPTLTLFLVRHAESQNNAVNAKYASLAWEKFLRSSDPDLSEVGNQQIAKLKSYFATSSSETTQHLRAAAANGGDRFLFFSSPMRRALKTSSALAAGLQYKNVIVDPNLFEEGGCFHDFPDMSDMKGLEHLQHMSQSELDALKTSGQQPTTYPGLSEADVRDATKLSDSLGVTPETASFVGDVMPGMENGWYAEFDQRETRQGCYQRAKTFVDKVRGIAMNDAADDIVLVSHGDLMDAVLKNFIASGASAIASAGDQTLDHSVRFAHTNTGITRVEVGKADGMAHISL